MAKKLGAIIAGFQRRIRLGATSRRRGFLRDLQVDDPVFGRANKFTAAAPKGVGGRRDWKKFFQGAVARNATTDARTYMYTHERTVARASVCIYTFVMI